MKSYFKLREETARDRWNTAAAERQKKHDEIEAKRVAAAKQGKENMSGAIDKLSHILYKEEKTPAVKKTKKSFRDVHPSSESELNIQRGHSSSVTTEEVSHYTVHAFSSNLQQIGKPTKHTTKDEADTEGHNYSAQGHVVVQHNKNGSKKVATASFEPGTGAFEKSEMKERALKEDDADRVQALVDKIKVMRRAGLAQHGEFGPENLVFKMLRTQGWITGLQLAALSLPHAGDPARFIRQFAGDDRHITDFLLEEVLRSRPSGTPRNS